MQLADLNLFHAVVEVRYAPAYPLWDRTGSLWAKLDLHFPGLRMLGVQPNLAAFRLGNDFEFTVGLESAVLSAFKPNRTLAQFGEHANYFFPLVVEMLEIAELSRVGCRLMYTKEYPSAEEASEALLESGALKWPEGKHFNHSGRPVRPEWAFRWEDGETGVHIRLRIDERKYDFVPPLVWEGPLPDKKDHIALTYDVDWYTGAPVLVTQISFDDWIKQRIHLTNRDSDEFLEGVK
jgi:hypothetical protein